MLKYIWECDEKYQFSANETERDENMDDAVSIGLILGCIIGGVVGLALYFLPTIIAFKRDQLNKVSVFLLNLFLGWSLIGWVISLVWATKKESAPVQVINNYTPPQQ